jgi:hypothetical protein
MTSYLTNEPLSMHVYRLLTTCMHYCINMNWFYTRYVCIYSNIKRIIRIWLSLPPIFELFGQHSSMWKTVYISKPAVVFNSTTSLFLTPSDPSNRKYMLYKWVLWVQQQIMVFAPRLVCINSQIGSGEIVWIHEWGQSVSVNLRSFIFFRIGLK